MGDVGLKFDSKKSRLDLLPTEPLFEVAQVLEFGAAKYGEWNWAHGISYTRILGATLRHVFAYLRGESTDPETGISHMAHAACNCLFILYYNHYKPEFDDRRKHDATP